jgi:hypothetical protein
MKLLALACSLSLFAFGCGDDGGDDDTATVDAAVSSNPGFVPPEGVTTAWDSQGGQWVEVGPADWSCLGTPSDDQPTAGAVTLSGAVDDFQTGDPVPGATVSVFPGVDFDNPVDTVTADANGDYTATLPAGTTRFGFKAEADGTLDTYLLNQVVADPQATTAGFTVNSVSELTANALPAFIGVTRTPGLGVLAGAMRDCDNNEVSNAIVTVSGTSGEADHLGGAETYYFSAGSTELPVRHNQQLATNSNGLFVVIEIPIAAEAYVQVWGFQDQAALDGGDLTLLAEIPAPVVADSVITTSLEPLRQ